MTSYLMPICAVCQHITEGDGSSPPVCVSFPKGIPQAIWTSQKDHRHPIAGDHGIQFDPVNSAATEYAEALFAKPTTS